MSGKCNSIRAYYLKLSHSKSHCYDTLDLKITATTVRAYSVKITNYAKSNQEYNEMVTCYTDGGECLRQEFSDRFERRCHVTTIHGVGQCIRDYGFFIPPVTDAETLLGQRIVRDSEVL